MKMAFFALLFATQAAVASDFNCTATAFALDNIQKDNLNAELNHVALKTGPNSSPGFAQADLDFDLGSGYEIKAVVSVGTQIDASKPVGRLNDYTVWYRYVVLKNESGHKRALGDGMVGEVTATESHGHGFCPHTVCAAGLTGNVDVETVLANQPGNMSADEAFKKGLISGDTPSGFDINCNWDK